MVSQSRILVRVQTSNSLEKCDFIRLEIGLALSGENSKDFIWTV